MDIALVQRYLDSPEEAAIWFRSLSVTRLDRAHANLVGIATSGLTLDLVADIAGQLEEHLGGCPDPDMALNNIERFIRSARSSLAMGALFQRDHTALPALIQLFSTSHHLSDILIADPESFELLRQTGGRPLPRQTVIENIVGEIGSLEHGPLVLRALRRYKRRETLRIAYGDIVMEQPLPTVTKQISYLAESLLEASLLSAWEKVVEKCGTPRTTDGRKVGFVVLALGKLGGEELNYSSDIDLILIYEQDGATDHTRPITNSEFFARLSREMVNLLTQMTELGSVYRVDLRLRPDGDQGPVAISYNAAFEYYENRGRTWERQAMIKARAVAGDIALGERFLSRLTSWIFPRYLTRADISGIRALKRRIENRAMREGCDESNVKTGLGGIRDIEFTIQFLQLLHGCDSPFLHTGNTLEAIGRLEMVGCLSHMESDILQESYTFLRRTEHLLQIMCDLQTHDLPKDPDERNKLARRLGYENTAGASPREQFEMDYADKTAINRKIQNHLLHNAFDDDPDAAAEVDLVLDPDPTEKEIEEVLGRYPFRDVRTAYRNLMSLSEEKIRFLSTRRCRHFLASIAPSILESIARSPDPDATLVNLGQVSDSIGGKGVLWELFSFNRPSLDLYVRLCAYAPYLCSILMSNPGMIDGLMDSLVLDRLPSRQTLRNMLQDLCRGAEDTEPILHSFKNDQQLCVGVRDLLDKSDVRETTGTLSDIAQVCLEQIVDEEYRKLITKIGEPSVQSGENEGGVSEIAIVAMGKFGGHELNYHSDLDIVFLFEAEGNTRPTMMSLSRQSTTNQHFYGELGQRIISRIGRLGAYGRLYEIDARLRPTGRTGPLATSLEAFEKYFSEGGEGQLWERQALCRARVIYGSPRMEKLATSVLNRALYERRWRKIHAKEIREMRERLEKSVPDRNNMKRGVGGMVDIEFLVQMLQLRFGRRNPKIRSTNTLDALELLTAAEYLSPEDGEFFSRSYRFMRRLESDLKLMNQPSTSKIPDDPTDRLRLAHLMRIEDVDQLIGEYENVMKETRDRFERVFAENGA